MPDYNFDWGKFPLKQHQSLMKMIQRPYEEVPFGGKYYGRVSIGDVCYDIQAEHYEDKEKEIYVGFSPYVPHYANGKPAYDSTIEALPYDYIDEGFFALPKEKVLPLPYEKFEETVENLLMQALRQPSLQGNAIHRTNFWENHDRAANTLKLMPSLHRKKIPSLP